MWNLTHTPLCPYWTPGEDDADTASGPDEHIRSTSGQLPECIRTLADTTSERRQMPSSGGVSDGQ